VQTADMTLHFLLNVNTEQRKEQSQSTFGNTKHFKWWLYYFYIITIPLFFLWIKMLHTYKKYVKQHSIQLSKVVVFLDS